MLVLIFNKLNLRHQARYNSMELGLILGRNLEKPGKRQNLGVFQGFSRSNFAFLPFSRFSRFFQVFQVTWQPWIWHISHRKGNFVEKYRSSLYVHELDAREPG